MKRRKYDKGRWALERERHQIDRQTPPLPDQSAEIADVIPDVMKHMGLEKKLWEHELLDQWTSVVGPQVAAHAKPGRLDRGTLVVFVSHPGWLSELERYGKKEMLKKIQQQFGEAKVRTIRLQLDPDAGREKR